MRRLCPHRLGLFVQVNAQRILLLVSLALLVLCAAFNSIRLDIELSSWIQRTARINNELLAIDAAIGDGSGSNSLLILQKPSRHQQHYRKNKNLDKLNDNVLSVESLMIHLEALAIATHTTIDLFDISWSLKDICFSPTLPDYEGLLANQMLDHLMPCAIKTPLDCFWEGSKLLGPEQDVRLSSIGPKLKWTSLNPIVMVEAKKRDQPHASFPYDSLLNWMRRVGMTTGYQERPCLDPTDPNCPISAPNKSNGGAPNVAAELTGGCKGFATNQMHWKEEEIVGGIERNHSGFITRAEALQSTIQMMGERDLYDYWRKTSKVQDVNNWSIDKAKLVLDNWQKRFKEELAQFTRSSIASNSYQILALTPNSMLEPIDSKTILDLTNFKLTILLCTICICALFPNFRQSRSPKEDGSNHIDRSSNSSCGISLLRIIFLAVVSSLIVTLTFIASLGLSSLMNLPLNMATTQILPTLALYYGSRQALLIANIYAKNYKNIPSTNLTTECLNEILPILLLESVAMIVSLAIASIFPIHATRVFITQAIVYICLSSSTAILLIPSLLVTMLIQHSHEFKADTLIQITYNSKTKRKCVSPSLSSTKSEKISNSDNYIKPSIEEQIFSRLQEDLKIMRAEAESPTNINFSLRADGSKTSFKITASMAHNKTPPSFGTTNSNMNNNLPDLLLPHTKEDPMKPNIKGSLASEQNYTCIQSILDNNSQESAKNSRKMSLVDTLSNILTSNSYICVAICMCRLLVFGLMMIQASNVKYGLQLRDIVIRDTIDYESFSLQEKYFPVYNIFVITTGEFDYPSNQRFLHEFQQRMEEVESIVKDEQHRTQPKFWLSYFRDWLIELQNQFDQDRNKSAISKEGWTQEATDASKLAFKLLAQTGRSDNPIDKNQVESTRLVDRNGIINQKAFYYYLTAWVMNDAFTYSNSEANLKPEPKTWNENPEDLRIERAKPITYAQIPYLLKMPENSDGLNTIVEIRSISQAFEQLGLRNFPTGIPFIFWDQFINLDLLFIVLLLVVITLLSLSTTLILTDLSLTMIIIGPAILTTLELYTLLGILSIKFNSVVAVLIISSVSVVLSQNVYNATLYQIVDGNLEWKIKRVLYHGSRMAITSILLIFASACVFKSSRIDFIVQYSSAIFYLVGSNSFNLLVLTPSLFALFGSNTKNVVELPEKTISNNLCNTKAQDIQRNKLIGYSRRKMSLQRVQSQISLSTISEEPQAASPLSNRISDVYSQNAIHSYLR